MAGCCWAQRTNSDGTYAMRADFTYNAEAWLTTEMRYASLTTATLVVETDTGYDGAGNVTHIRSRDGTSTTIYQFNYRIWIATTWVGSPVASRGATSRSPQAPGQIPGIIHDLSHYCWLIFLIASLSSLASTQLVHS